LDIGVILDGSHSLSNPFSGHPNGYYALLDIMKNWAGSMSLSGKGAKETSTADDGARVSFVQFSGYPTKLKLDPENPCFKCLQTSAVQEDYKGCDCYPLRDDMAVAPPGTGTGSKAR